MLSNGCSLLLLHVLCLKIVGEVGALDFYILILVGAMTQAEL